MDVENFYSHLVLGIVLLEYFVLFYQKCKAGREHFFLPQMPLDMYPEVLYLV